MAAKLFVVDAGTGEKIPFLRGILVQSLVAAGVSFANAYEVALSAAWWARNWSSASARTRGWPMTPVISANARF